MGLKADGTVITVCKNEENIIDTSHWSDIVAISAASYGHTVGLKADGTVVAVGKNDRYNWDGHSNSHVYCGQCDTSGWRDIGPVLEEEVQSLQWQEQSLCKYCGGKLGGLFTKKCKTCGREN